MLRGTIDNYAFLPAETGDVVCQGYLNGVDWTTTPIVGVDIDQRRITTAAGFIYQLGASQDTSWGMALLVNCPRKYSLFRDLI
jgi:hypothetical protein